MLFLLKASIFIEEENKIEMKKIRPIYATFSDELKIYSRLLWRSQPTKKANIPTSMLNDTTVGVFCIQHKHSKMKLYDYAQSTPFFDIV